MHPEIEKLIELALADGVLTEKEKSVILRKAELLGEDVDEVEMILEGKLAQTRKQPTLSTTQKQGTVKKCPACGASLGALASSCAECGHEIADIEASRTIIALYDKFGMIEKETESLGSVADKRRMDAIKTKKAAAIRDFPVPNSREELQQLILFIKPKIIESENSDPNFHDWKIKFSEVLDRARNAYKNDSKMIAEFDRIEASLKSSVSTKLLIGAKKNPGKVAGLGTLFILIIVSTFIYVDNKAKLLQCEAKHDKASIVEKTRLDRALENVNKAFTGKNYSEALTQAAQMKWEYEDECKVEETLKLKALWDEKRNNISTLVQKQIDADAAEKKAEAERVAAEAERVASEKKAEAERLAAEKQELIRLQVAKEQAEAQKAEAQKAQTQAAAQAQRQPQAQPQQAQNPQAQNPQAQMLQLFGNIMGNALNANKK